MLLGLIAFTALVIAVGLWLGHKGRDVEDYDEREHREPPIHGWFPGDGPGGT
jgi:hypothetical protein